MKLKYFSILLVFFFSIKTATAQTDSLTVYVFLSETCPICQLQTISLRALNEQFKAKGIKMIGVFPNIQVSDSASIYQFKKKYKLDFDVQLDDNQSLTQKLNAEVTPQVFVVLNETQSILYQGKVDNSYERVGKRRQYVTAFYLKDVLNQILDNQCISIKNTDAVGCFIMK